MQPNYLHYDPHSNHFLFQTQNVNAVRIFNVARTHNQDGFLFTFPAAYPSAILSLRDFSKIISNRGTDTARAKIEDLKQTEQNVKNLRSITEARERGFEFKGTLMDHQPEAVETMLAADQLAILYEQGLGKSCITLSYLSIKHFLIQERLQTNKPLGALIFAPKIVIPNWSEEIGKFSDFSHITYAGTIKQREKLRHRIVEEQPDIILLTYDILAPKKNGSGSEELQEFVRFNYDFVIIDEASKVKTHNSIRTKTLTNVVTKARHRYILSGTISTGSPLDVYAPYTILSPAIFGTNFFKFKQKYCEFSPWNKHIVVGYKNLEHLKNRITPFTIVKNREDCLTLPDRTFIDRFYEVSEEQKQFYNEIINNESININGREINVALSIIKLNKLMQVLSGFLILPPKREYKACNYCNNLLKCIQEYTFPWTQGCIHYQTNKENNTLPKQPEREYFLFNNNGKKETLKEELELTRKDEKVIIWSYYQHDLTTIKEVLTKLKLAYIEASQHGSDRTFNDTPDIKAYIGQISQGIGTTLNSSAKTIYYSHSLKLDDRLQSMDRNYRIGQKEKVVVVDFINPNSIEKPIIQLLRNKKDVRDFIHSAPQCVLCEKFDWCQPRDIKPYSKKCVLAGQVEAIESKKLIKIQEMR